MYHYSCSSQFIETGSTLWFLGLRRGVDGELLFNGDRVSLWDGEELWTWLVVKVT